MASANKLGEHLGEWVACKHCSYLHHPKSTGLLRDKCRGGCDRNKPTGGDDTWEPESNLTIIDWMKQKLESNAV